jgi:hypothetical protein
VFSADDENIKGDSGRMEGMILKLLYIFTTVCHLLFYYPDPVQTISHHVISKIYFYISHTEIRSLNLHTMG